MGLFSWLFGSEPPRVVTRGTTSILALILKDTKIETATCSLDKHTFPMPSNRLTFANLPAGGLTIDVGGYCGVCPGHRCDGHTMLIEVPMELWNVVDGGAKAEARYREAIKEGSLYKQWVLGCRKCGNPYGLPSKEAAEVFRREVEQLRGRVQLKGLGE